MKHKCLFNFYLNILFTDEDIVTTDTTRNVQIVNNLQPSVSVQKPCSTISLVSEDLSVSIKSAAGYLNVLVLNF